MIKITLSDKSAILYIFNWMHSERHEECKRKKIEILSVECIMGKKNGKTDPHL